MQLRHCAAGLMVGEEVCLRLRRRSAVFVLAAVKVNEGDSVLSVVQLLHCDFTVEDYAVSLH